MTQQVKLQLNSIVALSTLLSIPATAMAGVVVTGDPTTTTGINFTNAGNSSDAGIQADITGAGYNYDIFVGKYTVDGSDTFTGSNVIGNTAEGLTGGSFNVGDSILAIAFKPTTQNSGGSQEVVSNGFFKFDANNDSYAPATAPGGAKTSFGLADPGDYQLSTSRNFGGEFRVDGFRFNDGSNPSTYPLQDGTSEPQTPRGGFFNDPAADLPFRTFGVNGNPGNTPTLLSQILLVNLTDLNALSFNGQDVNDLGDNFTFYTFLGNGDGQTGAVIQVVPEPVAAMGGLSLLSLIGLRRRQLAVV